MLHDLSDLNQAVSGEEFKVELALQSYAKLLLKQNWLESKAGSLSDGQKMNIYAAMTPAMIAAEKGVLDVAAEQLF